MKFLADEGVDKSLVTLLNTDITKVIRFKQPLQKTGLYCRNTILVFLSCVY
jgi:hypothetical protein